MVGYEPMKKPLTVRIVEALGWLYVILTVVFDDLKEPVLIGALRIDVLSAVIIQIQDDIADLLQQLLISLHLDPLVLPR